MRVCTACTSSTLQATSFRFFFGALSVSDDVSAYELEKELSDAVGITQQALDDHCVLNTELLGNAFGTFAPLIYSKQVLLQAATVYLDAQFRKRRATLTAHLHNVHGITSTATALTHFIHDHLAPLKPQLGLSEEELLTRKEKEELLFARGKRLVDEAGWVHGSGGLTGAIRTVFDRSHAIDQQKLYAQLNQIHLTTALRQRVRARLVAYVQSKQAE